MKRLLDFFTFCSLPGYFRQIICSKIILMSKVNVKFIDVSKSGLGFKISQSYPEISHFFWLNSCKIVGLWKNRKIQKFKISPVFNIKLLLWSFFIIIKCFLLKTDYILIFLNFSIFPRNDDFAGVESEKMRYLGIGLTDFKSKTSFEKVIKFYNNFQMALTWY